MSTETDARRNTDVETDVDPDRIGFEAAQSEHAQSSQRQIQLSGRELSLGIVALALWFVLFSGGILIATQPYRLELENPSGVTTMIVSWLVVCAFWTITNIGILSCIAALIGALGRRTRFTSRTDPFQSAIDARDPGNQGVATFYVSAIMRGFGVYALVLAGLLVLATDSLTSPAQDTYMRLAPTVSIISFYAGYDPSIFAGLLDRVKSFMQAGNQEIG